MSGPYASNTHIRNGRAQMRQPPGVVEQAQGFLWTVVDAVGLFVRTLVNPGAAGPTAQGAAREQRPNPFAGRGNRVGGAGGGGGGGSGAPGNRRPGGNIRGVDGIRQQGGS